MKNDKIVFRIADLAAMLLKAFKPILCTALIFALLGGCFGFFRALHVGKNLSALEGKLRAAEEAAAASEEALTEAEKALPRRTDVEIPQAESLCGHAKEMTEIRQKYLENSLYCAIDPFHCGVARLTLRVEAQNGASETPFSPLTASLSRLFSESGELFPAIQRIMKTDAEPAYIRELVSVTQLSDSLAEITVYGSDPQIAEQCADAVCAELNRYLCRDLFFTSEIVDRFSGFEVNWEMRGRQLSSKEDLIAAEQALISAEKELQRMREELPTLEKAAKDARSAFESGQKMLQNAQKQFERSLFTTGNVVRRILLYMGVMLLAGFLLSFLSVVVFRAAGNRLPNPNAILTGCKYPLLGVLPNETPRPFDKTIRKLEGDGDTDMETAAKSAAQTLLSLVGERRVCFVSSLGKEAVDPLVSLTEKRIPVCGDLVNDPEAIKALSDFDGIILAEKTDRSLLSAIDAEIRRAEALGKEILGVVLI